MPAIDAALAVTGASHAHLVGYCIGGTLAMITAACMARDHDERLRTLTLFAAQGDFKEAGEVRLFIDDSQLALLEDMMWEQGALESNQMAGTFSLLRSNDLIWSRAIHKYLMGEPEQVDDLMAWNSDATRMPYKMHSEYLRELFLDNDLAEGRFKLDGRLVALQDIRAPLFVVGTERDHVAPWRSVFKIHYLTDTDITCALVSGGHNRGIVAPPGQGKSVSTFGLQRLRRAIRDRIPRRGPPPLRTETDPGGPPGSTGLPTIQPGSSRRRRSALRTRASPRSATRPANMCGNEETLRR